MRNLADDLRSLGIPPPGNLPPPSKPGPAIIRARRCGHPEDFAALSVRDPYPTHEASRGILTFRNVDEVMQTIAALESVLPAIERLGRLAV